MNPSLALLSTLVGGATLLKDVSKKSGSELGVGTGTYAAGVGARTKQEANVVRAAKFLARGRAVGVSYKELGVMLRMLGYTPQQLRSVIQFVRQEIAANNLYGRLV